MSGSARFPFTAIVGQQDMKDALLCNAVHPGIGGVLISGTRGTAKSTAVRSLARLLPRIRAVADCPFHCPPDEPEMQCESCVQRDLEGRPELVEEIRTPFVNLPIGATEDRVLGTIDLESAIQEGERSFQPGLLARANRGILYVDEVNLLGDHLVDVLLDAVATGTNRVEREGISVEHPSNVMLVGTMNPEEGELRPQLLDRFGLYVEMESGMAPEARKAVVRRRTNYEDDPDGMLAEWRQQEATLRERIETARETVADVGIADDLLDRIVNLCVEHDVDGLRADIVIHRTARVLAALEGRRAVEESHVRRAAELALGHRSGSSPTSDPGGPDSSGGGEPDREFTERPPPEQLPDLGRSSPEPDAPESSDGAEEPDDGGDRAEAGSGTDRVFPVTSGPEPPQPEPDPRIELPEPTGRGGRTRTISSDRQGSYYRARRPTGPLGDIALDATVRAAAPYQRSRAAGADAEMAVRLRPSDLREKRRESRVRNLAVFVVDSSGSMGADGRMSAVKGTILSLLADADQRRDYVSLVGFRKDRAETLLAPTSSVRRAARELAEMPTGGRTPLAAGLERGLELVNRERRKQSNLAPLLVVVTDGRSNYAGTERSPVGAALNRANRIRNADVSAACFDTETGPVRTGLVRKLADRMDAAYYRFDELEPERLVATMDDLLSDDSRAGP